MKRGLGSVLLAILLAVGAGCDREGRPLQEAGLDRLAKGVSTEAEVRMVMGPPDSAWQESDGSHILQYPKGPEGGRTWQFVIDPSGKLRDYEQILTERNFARITPGMTREQVRRILGRPKSVVPFQRKNEEVWDWRYLVDTGGTRFFNVHFDLRTGNVVRTSTSDNLTD